MINKAEKEGGFRPAPSPCDNHDQASSPSSLCLTRTSRIHTAARRRLKYPPLACGRGFRGREGTYAAAVLSHKRKRRVAAHTTGRRREERGESRQCTAACVKGR